MWHLCIVRHVLLATLLACMSLQDGLADCDKALEMQPDFADAQSVRGVIKRLSGDLEVRCLRAWKYPHGPFEAVCENRCLLNHTWYHGALRYPATGRHHELTEHASSGQQTTGEARIQC